MIRYGVPREYARDGIFSVLIDGDSMSGGDIHEGNFVIVDPTQRAADKDLALVRMGGSEDNKELVKRVRLQPNGRLRALESSNPQYDPIRGRSLEGAVVQDKVIGVFRPIG